MGAFERLNNAGIKQLAAIHRGFSMADNGKYRNKPNWHIPIELKRRVPELPVICDPSHICGTRKFLQHISQEAIDLLFHGLMLEVHPDPDNALSDNAQQLTPAAFIDLISSLEPKKELSSDIEFQNTLTILREEIDKIDADIIKLLGDRMKIAENIGQSKKQQHVTVLQPSRWQEILASRVEEGKKRKLSSEFTTGIYQLIHEEAVRHQEDEL
jgi:chorismate mutase